MIEFILNNLGIIFSIVLAIVIFYATQRIMKHFTYCERIIEKIGQFVANKENTTSKIEDAISTEEKEILRKIRLLDEKKRERLLERLETLAEEENCY